MSGIHRVADEGLIQLAPKVGVAVAMFVVVQWWPAILEQRLRAIKPLSVSTLDGIRLSFEDG